MSTSIKSNEELKLIKTSKFSCVFFHAEGCIHCENAKPIVAELDSKLPDVDFFLIQADGFPEAFEFYTQYAELQPVLDTVMNGDKPMLDHNGNVVTVPRIDDSGNPVMEPLIAIPQFYLMANSEIDEDNPYGFIGKVSGFAPEKLEAVLLKFKELY
jgi:thiol-disulfide isomerase/thioredoxin